MAKKQKLNIITNAKQKSYNLNEALAQKPESTNSEGKEFHAQLEKKARLPYSTYEPGGYSGPK